jgi:hypothetical protein
MDQASQPEAGQHELSTRDKLDRVIEAGQRMIAARFDLLSLELKQTLSAGLKTGLFSSLGVAMLLLGHIAGMIAAALGMAVVMPAWAAVLIVAGIHFVLGGVGLAIGVTQPHAPKLGIKPDEMHEAHRRLPSRSTGRPLPRPLARPLVPGPQRS